MASISPSDSVRLHEFLAEGPDHFQTLIPALALLVGVLLTQFIEWLRRNSEATREDRRFIHRRWWDRRADAYSEIMKSLARLRAVVGAEIDSLGTERTLTDEQIKRWRQARVVLDDAMNQGMFMISDDALECLKELERKMTENDSLGQKGDHEGELYGDLDAIGKVIPRLVEIARRDLGNEHLPEVRDGNKRPR